MRSIFCKTCGDKQRVPENSDSFVCSNCGHAYQINADGELFTISFKAGQNGQGTSWVKKWDSEIRSLFSNPKTPVLEESTTEQSKSEKLSNVILTLLSTAVVISLVFLFFIVIREIRSKRPAPPPTSNLSNLPKYDPELYQTATRTAIPSWTLTATITITPTPTPIMGSVKTLTLNLRAGPGVGFHVLKELKQDEMVTLLARNELSSWVVVETTDGHHGWVSASFIQHDSDLSKLEVDNQIFTIAVTGITPTVTNTLIATITKKPTFTQYPTLPHTPTPRLIIKPPAGKWCEQNSVREICVYEMEYFINTVNDDSEPANTRYLIMDVSVQNLVSFDIFVDPSEFTLILEDGSFSFFFTAPEAVYGDNKKLLLTTIAPGESVRGTIIFSISETNAPEKLTYQGYLYEPSITIDFNDVP